MSVPQFQKFAADIPVVSFEQDGMLYSIGICVGYYTDEKFFPMSIGLRFVQECSFSSKFNELFSRGTLTFTDQKGQFDKYLNNQNSIVSIYFSCQQKSGSSIPNPKKYHEISEEYMIDNVQVLKKDYAEITYKVDLVSRNILRLMEPIKFPDHNTEISESGYGMYEIIQKILTQQGIETQDKFLRYDTERSIKYTTTGYDNTLTIYKNISDQAYKNSSSIMYGIRGLYYDFFSDKICPCVLGSIGEKIGSIVMSVADGDIKPYFEGRSGGINIGSVIRKSNSQVYNSVIGYRNYSYDFETNSITDNIIKSDELLQVYGRLEKDRKYKEYETTQKDSYHYVSDWSCPATIYYDMVSNMIDHNSLIIEQVGKMGLMVGDIIGLATEGGQENGMYSEYEGYWAVSKVENILKPSDQKYRQKVCLVKCLQSNVKK